MFIAALFIKVMNYETVQMFITRRMNNQIPLYGILLSNKKKSKLLIESTLMNLRDMPSERSLSQNKLYSVIGFT